MDLQEKANNIIKRMPDGLSKLEQARYIYINLGKLVSFDEKYWLGTVKEEKRIYKSARSVYDLKNNNDGKIICMSLSNIYCKMLEGIGIKSNTYIEDMKDPHVYPIIRLEDTIIKADLQRDLKYIQSKRKTKHFGKSMIYEDKNLSDLEMENLDSKIGYEYEGEELEKQIIEYIKKISMQDNMSVSKKVEYILNELSSKEYIQNMGFKEKLDFYSSVIYKCLGNSENMRISRNELETRKKEDKRYTSCISIKEGANKYKRYIYSHKQKIFLDIEEEKLQELIQYDLKEVGMLKIPGLKKDIIRMSKLKNRGREFEL